MRSFVWGARVFNAVEEVVDRHRDAVLGRVPLAKAADAIVATASAAAQRGDKVLASESYDEDEYDLHTAEAGEEEASSGCEQDHSSNCKCSLL